MSTPLNLDEIATRILSNPAVKQAIVAALSRELSGATRDTPVARTPTREGAVPGIIELIPNYSEKVFLAIGDTRPHKDILKALGGKFGPHYKIDGGSPGWMFRVEDFGTIQIKLTEAGIKYKIRGGPISTPGRAEGWAPMTHQQESDGDDVDDAPPYPGTRRA